MTKKNKQEKTFIPKWESQLRKGTLDFIILHFLRKKEYYGYELISEIKHSASMNISEGTVYPLLTRLKTEGFIDSRWEERETGVPRKYYRVTEEGRRVYREMKTALKEYNRVIDQLTEAS